MVPPGGPGRRRQPARTAPRKRHERDRRRDHRHGLHGRVPCAGLHRRGRCSSRTCGRGWRWWPTSTGRGRAGARAFGFRAPHRLARAGDDPAVGLVSITSPNILHKEMALAAIAAGKHVYCEKPLALTAADARELTLAAEAAGVRTWSATTTVLAGDPAHQGLLTGELGHLTYFARRFEEDYMADPAVPFSWRCERARAGSGALGDMGSHAISLARFLGGPIVEVLGDTAMVVPSGRCPPGSGRVEQPRAAQGRERGHRALPVPLRQRRARQRSHQPHRLGPQERPRPRGLRHARAGALPPGAVQRVRAVPRQRSARTTTAIAPCLRAGPRRLRPVHARPRPRHRLQRPEGDRGRAPAPGGDRRRAARPTPTSARAGRSRRSWTP